MRRKGTKQVLAALLLLAMVISMLPTAVFATGTATWSKVELTDIQPTDTIAITMTKEGTTWVLPNTGEGSKGQPLADQTGTIDGTTLTTDESTGLSWTITATEGGYHIHSGESYLYVTATNNGVRVGDTQAVWSVSDGYLTAKDSKDTARYLGVYNATDWRCYTSIHANIAGQTLEFWKLTDGGTTDPEPTPAAPIKDGDKVVIWAPAYNKALSTGKTGYYNLGVDITVTDGVMEGYGETEIFTVIDNGDGTYSFAYEGQNLGMADSFGSMDLGAVNDDWIITDLGDGLYNIQNKARGNYMEWYASKDNWSTYNSSSAATDDQFQLSFYVIPEEAPAGPVKDGDKVVIWAPAYNKALSTGKTGYYNLGVDITVTDGVMEGYGETEIFTVIDNGDGTYSFAYEGQNLGMADSFGSMDLGAVNDDWIITDLGDGLYNIQNKARGNYMEWYASKGNWSTYNSSSAATDDQFQLSFYVVTGQIGGEEEGDLPVVGDQIVIYNPSAEGVLGRQDDNVESPAINSVAATIVEDAAQCGNGALVFTVEKNGDYYRFYNETYGYLCSNGTGNNAFYSKDASDDADWTVTAGKEGGWNLMSRTAKYQGKYDQYLEYYGGSYKTYSMYKVTDYAIYEFHFYPVAEGTTVIEGVVDQPQVIFGNVLPAYVGQSYTLTFTVDTVFGVKELTVALGEQSLTATLEDGTYTVTVPAELIEGEKITITVTGKDDKDVSFSASQDVEVKDEPLISDLTPAVGAETGENKRPVISAAISNAGEAPTVTMTVNGEKVAAVYSNGKISYQPTADMEDGRVTVTVTVVRADGKEVSKSWAFTVGEATYQLYFGQLHSHTSYSDGSGSLQSALDYVLGLPGSANVDFVAFTDHSNYFDASGAANPESALYDLTKATAQSQKLWNEYKGAIADFNASQNKVVAIGGFEMTWSGGPGHINTFNTQGIVSRNNTTLNNKTNDAGLKAYYALLSQPEGVDSINQFNHPGNTFGTFVDFAYWDPVIDSRIQLIEVGNGEGQIGAGGYYPSYEYYTMALDKGWHVAPTNNQDNHKGKWGNANDARDVILTDDFSEEGIYEAIRAMRMYSTEDKNLEIGYYVNDMVMGSIIEEEPEKLEVLVTVTDPDASDSISKVEIIVNSGKVAYTWDDPAVLATGELTATLEPTYSYYYVRVTEGDGDLAVTAPVWVGESLKLGISSVVCGTSTPVTGEELTLTTTLFNSESNDATIKSIIYTTNGSVVIGTDNTQQTIPASGTLAVDFNWTPTQAKLTTVTVTALVEIDGVEYTFTMDVQLDVQNADELVYIGIDASHYNEYVAGNYKDSMGNFGALAAEHSVRTVELKTSQELIDACSNEKFKALILTAPSRRLAEAQEALLTYTQAELDAIAAFNKNGGVVILAGWSDNYEDYPDVFGENNANLPADKHMAATQNAVLEALGSSLRLGDDATYDDVRSAADGVDPWRLYFNTYGESFLTEGVEVDPEHPYDRLYTEVFSHYGGATVFTVDGKLPDTVTPVVFGHSTTYSKDTDGDGLGGENTPKYEYAEGDERLMIMATEQLEGQGLIVVSGAAFMSNFEVQATIEDSGSEKNYSNYKICENLLKMINPVKITDIADVRAQTEAGYKYTIQGIVTSNASGYDKDTAFFDCIYVQDATGGICCFPVAGDYRVGDLVQITGTTEFYQGEPELQVQSIELISRGNTVESTKVTAGQINDRSAEGLLVTLEGEVVSFELANGLVQTIMVKDAQGNIARVFIDGYITTDSEVEGLEVGCQICVTGLASYDDTFNAPEGPFPRIRVRDRADVVCTPAEKPVDPEVPPTGDQSLTRGLGDKHLTAAALVVLVDKKKRIV